MLDQHHACGPHAYTHTPWEADMLHSSLSPTAASTGPGFPGVRCLRNWVSESHRNILPVPCRLYSGSVPCGQKAPRRHRAQAPQWAVLQLLIPNKMVFCKCMMSQGNRSVGYRAASSFHIVCSVILNWPNQDGHPPPGVEGSLLISF